MRSKLSILTEICNAAGFSVTVNEFGEVTTANAKPVKQIDSLVFEFFGVCNPSDRNIEINESSTKEEKKKWAQSALQSMEYSKQLSKFKNEMKHYIIPFDNITLALKEWGEYALYCYGTDWFDEHDDFITVCQCIGADRECADDYEDE